MNKLNKLKILNKLMEEGKFLNSLISKNQKRKGKYNFSIN